jgi:hypothetical protein
MRLREYALAVAVLAASVLAVAIPAGVVAVVLLASSQPPPPGEAEFSQVPEQLTAEPKPEPTSDKESPQPASATLVQDKADPENRPHENQPAPQNEQPTGSWGDPITLFTGVLTLVAVFQLWLMYRQSSIMHDEMQATRAAAAAAQQSADIADKTLRIAERAHIVIGRMTLVDFFPGKSACVRFDIRNVGHTSAYFTDGKIRRQTNVAELPSPPDYGPPQLNPDNAMTNIWLAPDQKMGNEVGWKTPIDADDYWAVINGELNLTVFGYVTFTDVFGVSRTLGFGLRYMPAPKGGRFNYIGLPGYNYERENPLPQATA